jgi:hypothetical protein
MAVLGGAVTMGALLLHTLIHPLSDARAAASVGVQATSIRTPPMTLLIGVGYTTILAPVVLGVLSRVRKLFAFEQQRRSPGAMYR